MIALTGVVLDNKKSYRRRNDGLKMRTDMNLLVRFLLMVGAVFGVEGKKGI